MTNNLLRKLPKVDQLMLDERIQSCMPGIPREKAVDIIRSTVDEKRKMIIEGSMEETAAETLYDSVVADIVHALVLCGKNSLRPVINATGVVLHTNLGRANLSEKAREAVNAVMSSYSTLEYNPETRMRGSRHDHVEKIITRITGAEAAMVVNNNAAATMLTLAAMGRGREMVVSRGELVEIGGSFRIPDIMKESGTELVEVGTTNKTHLRDYEDNITENTAALLKVHTSNYRIVGFTEEVSVRELKNLGEKYGIPVIYDIGSGLMVDLSEAGIKEPTVKQGIDQGADLVLFSGDKLLGGPQAGIIIGKKEYIDRMKKHPLARVLRVDKMTLAACEATFGDYYSRAQALENIPVLSMITASEETLRSKAEYLKSLIDGLDLGYTSEILEEEGVVGGGSAPSDRLSDIVTAVKHENFSANEMDLLLHGGDNIIVSRTRNDRILFDVRTLTEKDCRDISLRLKEIAE